MEDKEKPKKKYRVVVRETTKPIKKATIKVTVGKPWEKMQRDKSRFFNNSLWRGDET